MFENQALEPRVFKDLERVKGSSTPKPRIKKYLTINYINYLAYISALSNTLFWITVWITAEVQDSRVECRGY